MITNIYVFIKGIIISTIYIYFLHELSRLLYRIISVIKIYSDSFETPCTYLHTRVLRVNR